MITGEQPQVNNDLGPRQYSIIQEEVIQEEVSESNKTKLFCLEINYFKYIF